MTDLLQDALAARDEALKRVEQAANEQWKNDALAAVRQTCEQRPDFISDDVWNVGGLDSTREDRALGPVFLKAARAGWCVKTDRTRPSVRSHGSGKPVWRSLLYDPEYGDGRLFAPPAVDAIRGEAA